MQQFTKCCLGHCNNEIPVENPRNKKKYRVVCDDCVAFYTPYCSVKKTPLKSAFYGVAKSMVSRAKKRDKKEVNIDYRDVLAVWPADNKCSILGIMLETADGITASRKKSPALSRIDPLKGYEVGNIEIISTIARRMKTDANGQELIKFAAWINKTYSIK